MIQLKAKILSALETLPQIYLFRLAAPEIAEEARPGQFVMVRCGKETILPRPISLHTAGGGEIALLVQVAGKGTLWLSQLKKGDTLDIFGPLGNGYTVDPRSRNLLLVAGGMGIAPLRFLAEAAAGEGKKVTVITGARSADCLVPLNPPQSAYNKGMLPASFQCLNATEDGSEGFKGLATQLIPHYLKGVDQVFACGPMPMYRTMAKIPELKNKNVQLSLEIMMGCGTGVCYGCTIKTKKGLKQVCQDGPVFEMGEMEWEA
ncbi:MAG: dihydroorotate dehydrogenase electron transfer subunit [Dehalococcoidales bacterium]|jgi:dihydroorotate dehydrogenase electron transfer subunit